MTLVLARHSTGEMLCDDSLDGSDIRYRAANKVVSRYGGLLGAAGTSGVVTRILYESAHIPLESLAMDALPKYVEGQSEWSCEAMWLGREGIYCLDQSGALDKVDTDWCAIGSGALAAMAIMHYTDGEANLMDVLESVAAMVPSVSPNGKIWKVTW